MSSAPPLDDKSHWFLQIIIRGLASDPQYLDAADYPEEIKNFLTSRMSQARLTEADLEDLDMPAEVLTLYTDLKNQRMSFPANDAAEKMAYFRVATTLLEKLINLMERAKNIRQVSQFYALVLSQMEEFLEPAQITKFRARLAAQGMGEVDK